MGIQGQSTDSCSAFLDLALALLGVLFFSDIKRMSLTSFNYISILCAEEIMINWSIYDSAVKKLNKICI